MNLLTLKSNVILPIAYTREGVSFDPNDNHWSIRSGCKAVSINFNKITSQIDYNFLTSLKKVLVWYGENHSIYHMDNVYQRLFHFLKATYETNSTPIINISAHHILNYYSSLDSRKKWYLSTLSGFLKKWFSLGYSGVEKDTINLLTNLSLKGNAKGVAVLTKDSEKGAFSDIELNSIQAALNKAYINKKVDTSSYLLAWLFMLFGQRPIQYALLKVSDIKAPLLKEDQPIYIINIPRAKQRKNYRKEFKERIITPQIGQLLWQYANDVKNRFTNILPQPELAPLFPEKASRQLQQEGMAFHQTAQNLAISLNKVLRGLEVHSERTGDFLHINTRRFRYTIGTRAAQEGHSELIIAELLDHTDTQNVSVYVEASPEIVERIDKSLALALAPLAQAFAGLISPPHKAGLNLKYVSNPTITQNYEPLGNCGSKGFCGFLAPIACYTCTNFQAWLDAPHDKVLDYLLKERERKLAVTDKRIASINDRTILAVADVIQRCDAIQKADQPQ